MDEELETKIGAVIVRPYGCEPYALQLRLRPHFTAFNGKKYYIILFRVVKIFSQAKQKILVDNFTLI
jgi:hypothetical protein